MCVDNEEICILEKRVAESQKQTRDIQAELFAARRKAAGVEIGMTVVGRDGEFRVCYIDARYSDVCLQGNPVKKDGTFGKSVRWIYGDWKVKS